MKVMEKFIRIGLCFLVILSLFLSLNIWFSSSRKENVGEKDTKIATPVNERTSKEIFLPLRLVRKQNNKTEMTSSENLITSVQNELEKVSFSHLKQVVKENSEEFIAYQELEDGFELLYEGQFLLSEYSKIYNLSFSDSDILESKNIYFSKILVDLKNEKILFFDFEKQDVYEATMTENTTTLAKLISKEGIQYELVTNQDDLGTKQYYLTNELKLKKYSYIIESQSVTRFRNAFFNDPENVRTNENNQDLTYTSGNERLSIFDDSKSRLVKFDGKIVAEKNQTIYSETLPYVKKLGKSMGNIRYFDRTDNQITYRTFVEGFPVFSEKSKGQVQMTVSDEYADEKSIQIETSMDTIQIPIPSDEEVNLESTENVLTQIIDAGGTTEKINSMIIGYTWQTIDETKSVVALTPEWYVCYNDIWYPENKLLLSLANREVK